MKNPLLLFFALVSFTAVGQTTWTQRLNYTFNNDYQNFDSATGVSEIALGHDGDLYILSTITDGAKEYIFKMSPSDSAIKWSVQVGYSELASVYNFQCLSNC